MIAALAMVAGTANAQTKFAPYPGSTYSYSLDIAITNQSDATLETTGGSAGTATVNTISPSLTDIPNTTTGITFNITYSNDAAGTFRLSFQITDEISECSNNIYYDITVATPPALALTITEVLDFCQQINTTTQSNNQDASIGAPNNTFTFIVTPGSLPTGMDSYDFTIDLNSYAYSNITLVSTTTNGTVTPHASNQGQITVEGATGTVANVFTVSFTTLEGAGTALTATVDNVDINMTLASGGGTFPGTGDTEDVAIKALPTIGNGTNPGFY